SHAGCEMEVLFECQENGFWVGYTGNFVRVVIRSNECLENTVGTVRLEQLCGDFMTGTLLTEAFASR
ncbi:MAG TPA: hypothetical protein PK869_09565, partial [Candidatus Hydrogenedentes bacterium]|nr:hypothetical protein [Candidatus Hydrogenedentota bacterium]